VEKEQFDMLSHQVFLLERSIREPLRALAVAQLAGEFYSPDERLQLVRSLSEMASAERAAVAAHKEVARSPERDALWQVVVKQSDQLKAARERHPLIWELVESRDALCRRDHTGRLMHVPINRD
jgi:hypothetical protein